MCGNGDCRPLVLGPNAIFTRSHSQFPTDEEIDRIQQSGRVGDFPEIPNPINPAPPSMNATPCPCCGAVHKPKTLAERLSFIQ